MFQLIIQNCLNVFQHTFQITAIKSTQTDVFSEKMAYFANYGNSWWCRVQGVRGGGERESRMERMDGSTVWAVGNVPPSYDTHSDCDCIQCVADCNIGGESPEPGCEILIWYRCNVGGVVVVVVGVGQICGEQMLFTTFSLTSAGSQQTQIFFSFK